MAFSGLCDHFFDQVDAGVMGVDIVLDGNADLDREMPAVSPNELVLTIRTRKVLYFNNSVDITDEVLEAVNSVK